MAVQGAVGKQLEGAVADRTSVFDGRKGSGISGSRREGGRGGEQAERVHEGDGGGTLVYFRKLLPEQDIA